MPLRRIPIPVDIALEDDGRTLVLGWGDGHRSPHTAFELRAECPCAGCVDEMTGRRTLRRETLSPGVTIVDYNRVGRYALTLVFSDGHGTGIFAYADLRATCPCATCRAEGVRAERPDGGEPQERRVS